MLDQKRREEGIEMRRSHPKTRPVDHSKHCNVSTGRQREKIHAYGGF